MSSIALDDGFAAAELANDDARSLLRCAANLLSAPEESRAQILAEAARALAAMRSPASPASTNSPTASTFSTPSSVVSRWRHEGPVRRLRTGIATLDEWCGGGLPVPRRVLLVGAPSAGKTTLLATIARELATAPEGPCVGYLAVDEDDEDVNIRFAQLAGFELTEIERRDLDTLEAIDASLRGVRVRFYDRQHTITSAADDLAAWAASEGRVAALFVDSIQTVRAPSDADTPRLAVEAAIAALRDAADRHRMLVVATSEANRASYREHGATDSNDMAAGAESRAIEYGAQTQLLLRTPKGLASVIHVRVTKNRRLRTGEFWLRVDHAKHSLTEIGNPDADPQAVHARAAKDASATRARLDADARRLVGLLGGRRSISTGDLRNTVALAGLSWGRDRLATAVARAREGIGEYRLVTTGDGSARVHHVERLAPQERQREP